MDKRVRGDIKLEKRRDDNEGKTMLNIRKVLNHKKKAKKTLWPRRLIITLERLKAGKQSK